MLLEYLVPSRARRQVLKTLGDEVTLRELARLADVPYSNAYGEVAGLAELGLVRVRPVGRALLCSWNTDNPAVKGLREFLRLTDQGDFTDPSDEDVRASLKHHGAPLSASAPGSRLLKLEPALAYGLSLARRKAEVARTWPVVFALNRDRVDLEALGKLAARLGLKKALGFLVQLTGELLGDRELAELAEQWRDGRTRRVENFFVRPQGPRAAALTEERTPETAKRWAFRMNMPFESFKQHFLKFLSGR